MMCGHLNSGIVCGVAREACHVNVVLRFGCQQWLVTEVPSHTLDFWKLRIGQTVLVDPTVQPPSLHTEKAGYRA